MKRLNQPMVQNALWIVGLTLGGMFFAIIGGWDVTVFLGSTLTCFIFGIIMAVLWQMTRSLREKP